LLKVGKQDVNTFGELGDALRGYDPGDDVALTVLHGDDERTLTAILDERDGTAFLDVSTCMGPVQERMYADGFPNEIERNIQILSAGGVQVTEVVEGSPAEGAGIQVEDIILRIDGEAVGLDASLADLVQSHQPGDRVELIISRDGVEKTLEVALGENPEVTGQAYLGVYYHMAGLGLMLDFNGEERFFDMPHSEMPHHDFEGEVPFGDAPFGDAPFGDAPFGDAPFGDAPFGDAPFGDAPFGDIPFLDKDMPGLHRYDQLPEGYEMALIIGKVLEGSPAEAASLQMDDLILELNGVAVEDVNLFVDEVGSRDPGDRITLVVYRDGEVQEVTVELGKHPDNPEKGYLGIMVAGFVKITIEGDIPEDFEFELEKDLKLPEGDA
jgi:membrane-associated protease RseP (regulator of RpoE activity)